MNARAAHESANVEQALVLECSSEQLVAVVHLAPDARAPIGVLVVVGGPQYRVGSHRQFTLMARALAAAGFPVMRFDYRGMGDSDGEFQGFESVGDDIRCALDAFVHAVPALQGVVLWGLCDGASAVLMGCNSDPRVRGVIIANPWVRTQASEAQVYLRHYYGTRFLQLAFWKKALSGGLNPISTLREIATKVRTAQASAPAAGSRTSFIDRMRSGWAAFKGPTLLLISGQDLTAKEFMDLSAASPEWQKLLRRPTVQTVELKEADHTFSQRAALDAATEHCRQALMRLGPELRRSA